ncbi:hypothetical protein ASE00_10070 [Sphingomonas sp. Root710]|uniref:MFS transporter n=1 Tax=Sphingomonas sp. Root710 TaxID=1736594 RepID=UPI0006F55302|nr:MFS transporter [Sphingomonas sp. Root710]KRB82404.1 hypothetical protein ASE00_10070 [Sphingomonas sp. Root710]
MQNDTIRLYQGRILLGCFLGVASGYSSAYFYSSGLLLIPIARDLGLSRGEATLALLVCSMTAAVMAPLLGRAVDRLGARLIGLVSLAGLAASFVICAWATSSLASLLACSVLIALLGAGSSSVSFSRLVVDAFDRHRGLALAMMQTGAGMGAFTIPFILSSTLQEGDWRGAYRLLASIVIVVGVLVAILIGTKRGGASAPAAPTGEASAAVRGWDIWSQRPFLLLAATFLLAANAIAASVVHFVPMMVDGGLTTARAAQLASLLGVALICGRLVTGWLLDRLVPEYVAAALFLITSVGLSILALEGASVAIIGALVVGLAMGSEVDLLCYLTARHFPRQHYGTAYGGLFGVFLFGSAMGPTIMGYLYDHAGSYRGGFLLAAAVLVGAAALVATLRRLHPRERVAEG